MSQSIVTPVGRASFPHLDKTNMYGKYTLGLLLPKDGKGVSEFVGWLKNAVRTEALDVAGEKGLADAMRQFSAFKDGDNIKAFQTPRAEYAGHWVLLMGRKSEFGKPCIVNRQKQPIDASEIYAGCNVVAYIDVFGYTYGKKKSVSIGFQHVMKVTENTPFASAGITAEAAFDSLELDDEDEELRMKDFRDVDGAELFGGGRASEGKKTKKTDVFKQDDEDEDEDDAGTFNDPFTGV